MSMGKKEFIALADAIRASGEDLRPDQPLPSWVELMADFCQQQNPRFNRERWLAYIRGECGPSGGKIKRQPMPTEIDEGEEAYKEHTCPYGGRV